MVMPVNDGGSALKPPVPSKPEPQADPAPAPPPPVSENKSVRDGKQECPLKAKIPCDCKKLTVTCVYSASGASKTRMLSADKKKRGQPISGKPSKSVLDLLGRYDFVIDMVAGYYSHDDPNPDKLKLSAKGEFLGDACGFHVHPAMTMKGLGPVPELPKGEIWKKGTEIGPLELLASDVAQDLGQPQGIMVILDIIKSLWPLYAPKQIEVKELACGIRPEGVPGAPAADLVSLVRIFRHDKYSVGLKMPALFSMETSKDGTVTGEKKLGSESSSSSLFGHNQSESKGEREGENYSYTQTSYSGSKGSAYELSSKTEDGHTTRVSSQQSTSGEGTKYTSEDDVTTVGVMKELEKKGHGFSLFIKRNGHDLTKEIKPGEKKSMLDLVLDGIDKAIDALSKLHELFTKVPQLGWKFSLDVSLLEGELALQWETKHVDEPQFEERYFPVEHKLAVTIAMTLVGIKLDLSFGVDAQACGTGVVLKVGGNVSLTVMAEASLTIEQKKPKAEVELKPSAKASIYGDGKASVFGYSLADVHADVTACIDMPDGKLEFSYEHCIELKGHLKSEKMYLVGYAKFAHMGMKRLTPRLILDEFPIYTFQ